MVLELHSLESDDSMEQVEHRMGLDKPVHIDLLENTEEQVADVDRDRWEHE